MGIKFVHLQYVRARATLLYIRVDIFFNRTNA
jgi:hypothetical protein